MAAPNNPHDALAKWTFSKPTEAAALLRSVLPPELLQHIDFTALAPGTEEDIMTPAEQWKAEGRQKGRVEGRVEMLLRQLTVRFGRLSVSTVDRVRRASDVELMRWAENVLTADALDAVFRD